MFRLVLAACGGFLVLLGAGTVAAWATACQPFIQFHTQLQPFHYNPALLLTAWGGGLLLAACDRRRGAAAAAIAVTLGGIGALAAGAMSFGPALATWAFPADPLLPAVPATGVHWLAAVGFVLGGVGLWLTARPGRGPAGDWLLVVLGIGVAFGTVAQLVNSPLFLGPPNQLGPPLLLCVGTLAGGAAALVAGVRATYPALPIRYVLAGGVWVGGLLLTVILWLALESKENERLHRLVQFDAAETHMLIQKALEDCAYRLSESAGKVRNKGEAALGQDDLSLYVGNRHGVYGLARLYADGRLRWVEPDARHPLPTTLDALGGAALAAAVRQGQPAVVRPPRSKWDGNWVLLFYCPIRSDDPAAGGLVAVTFTRPFLDAVFPHTVATGYALEVRDGPDVLYVRGGSEGPTGRAFAVHHKTQLTGLNWEVRQWPTSVVLDRESLPVAGLVLVAGVSLVTLLALAIYLAQTARRRAAALEREVRERVTAEAALRLSEARSRSLIDNLRHGVFLKDGDGRYMAANPSYCKLVGRPEADLVGRTDAEVAPLFAARWADVDGRVLEHGSAESEEEVSIDGQPRTVRRVLTPLLDAVGGRVGVLGMSWDVTDERAMEARLRQTGKLDALGQLAGGIAHDFNNLLTAIVGNLELARLKLSAQNPVVEMLDAAQCAADRASSLTNRLLGFARQHHLDWQVLNLGSVVGEVVSLLRRTIDPRVRLEAELPADLGLIEADPNQMNQVLMNLCINARDAINGPGCVRVRAANVDGGADRAGHDRPEGKYVRLSVQDDGGGMTPETMSKMFDPFFTTKEVGKGTGLGLAMVFGIVQGHNGWIECDSQVGVGTRFDLYFPQTNQPATDLIVPAAAPAPATGTATILLADDEDIVRRMAAMVLRQHGYNVLEAADGKQAVRAFAEEGAHIDLAVLDLTMPVLSGQDAFREIVQSHPNARVIFASGYASEQLEADETKKIAGYLKKPYRPQELVTCVREALEADAVRPLPA
jgi:PAS domain S-box-containing protein